MGREFAGLTCFRCKISLPHSADIVDISRATSTTEEWPAKWVARPTWTTQLHRRGPILQNWLAPSFPQLHSLRVCCRCCLGWTVVAVGSLAQRKPGFDLACLPCVPPSRYPGALKLQMKQDDITQPIYHCTLCSTPASLAAALDRGPSITRVSRRLPMQCFCRVPSSIWRGQGTAVLVAKPSPELD
jgi:hypothetical protein